MSIGPDDPRFAPLARYRRLCLRGPGEAITAWGMVSIEEMVAAHDAAALALSIHGDPCVMDDLEWYLDAEWCVCHRAAPDEEDEPCPTASPADPDDLRSSAGTAVGSPPSPRSGFPEAIGTATAPSAAPPGSMLAPRGVMTAKLRPGEAFLLTDGAGRRVILRNQELPMIVGQVRIIRRYTTNVVVARVRFCGRRRYAIAAPEWTILRVCPVAFGKRRSA